MSYLHLPRLTFSGDFISDVSTVNNDIQHYNNPTFIPSYQDPGQGATNGWWNPEGGATFNFQDCSINKVCYADGSSNNSEELYGFLIQGPEGRSTGKMVDLDPQQQMVSELWAVKLRITDKNNIVLLEGDIEVTPFRDLQLRQHDGSQINGQPMGASWTSVLKNIVWGENILDYRFFKELKVETHDNTLSVNLNGFGYYYTHAKDGRFSLGRILGAIGPWYRDEPNTFTSERRLFAIKQYGTATYFNISNFRFDEVTSRLSLDLGNSFPIVNSLGDIKIDLPLVLGISKTELINQPSTTDVVLSSNDVIEIGAISYTQGDWLMKTCGIIDIENVPSELRNNQLLLLNKVSDTQYKLIARESYQGFNVRADEMVHRIDSNKKSEIRFFGRQWGKAIVSGSVGVQKVPPNKSKKGNICIIPGNNYPPNGISLSSPTISIKDGIGHIIIEGNEINNPREYIDGQIYFLTYSLLNVPTDPANAAADAISIHLRDYFPVPERPKWSHIQEIMQQFSNLYPIMSKYIVDLGNREAVLEKKDILMFAFSQPIDSPMYMPVTRDLSETKRLTILKWLGSGGMYDDDDDISILSKESVLSKSKTPIYFESTEDPSDFHQKLIIATRMKNGEGSNYSSMDASKF